MKRRTFLFGISAMVLPNSFHHVANAHQKQLVKIPHKSVKMSKKDLDILIKTVFEESVGESSTGRMAVAHVIFNRLNSDYGEFQNSKTIHEICQKKFQFSCWLKRWKMSHIKTKSDDFEDVRHDVIKAIHYYNHGVDLSHNSLFYYAKWTHKPKWARKMKNVANIGNHKFYQPFLT